MLFDAHFHVVDPRFQLVPNQGYLPPAFDADAYRRAVAGRDVRGGAIGSGSPSDVELVRDRLGETLATRVLYENARAIYRC